MEKSTTALLIQANVIKDETALNANTAVRIGQMAIDEIDSLINKDFNELPLSAGATPGSFLVMRNDMTGRLEKIPVEWILPTSDTDEFEWDPGSDYIIDEVVTHEGFWYQALANNGASTTVVEPGTNPAVWEIINNPNSAIDFHHDTPSTAGGTIVFDFGHARFAVMICAPSFATPKLIAFGDDVVSFKQEFSFEITDIAATLEFNNTVKMSDVRFNVGTVDFIWRPDATGIYKGVGLWNGSSWLIDITGPYA